ncbi:hypothetical protein [Natronorubrum sp. DTA7]|uniref:hypothetical protein n=1 Tax=Natronorubrum sp. DTA7 TaxID=3447016 RepID=UPI003F86DFE5
MSLPDRSSLPVRTIERVYADLPLEVPSPVKNAYIRRTVDDDFGPFDHPPDPFATLTADPADVRSFTGRPYPPYHEKAAQLGTVRDGDWDRTDDAAIVDDDYRERYDLYRADRFAESVFFESMRAHFEDGLDWTETPFVERCLELADAGEPSWRSLTSREDILDRCGAIDALYERIERDGYRSQRDLGYGSLLGVTEEVLVDVGRDGDLLFVNGRHRLAIAKLLGLESIPVGVLVRHRDWMIYRDGCARSGTIPDHPDLRDLAEADG